MSKCTNLRPCHTQKLWMRHFLWQSAHARLNRARWCKKLCRCNKLCCVLLAFLFHCHAWILLWDSWSLFWMVDGKMQERGQARGEKNPVAPWWWARRLRPVGSTETRLAKEASALVGGSKPSHRRRTRRLGVSQTLNSYCCWTLALPPKP